MSSRDDEELAVLLADLERTLTDLQSAIDEDVRREFRGGRRPRRRPPTPGEILRFTEEYTLPTVISLLEATVQSLELLRAVLRLAGPRGVTDSTADDIRTRLESRGGPETAALRDALTDLRDALTGADLPDDSAARSILTDARELTAEIDDRLDEAATDRRDAEPTRRDRESRGVAIDVEEEADDAVDVDAELASIKESVAEESAADVDADDAAK
jgi:hypothetical protein